MTSQYNETFPFVNIMNCVYLGWYGTVLKVLNNPKENNKRCRKVYLVEYL